MGSICSEKSLRRMFLFLSPLGRKQEKTLCPSCSRPCCPIAVRIQNLGWTQLSIHHGVPLVLLSAGALSPTQYVLYMYMHSNGPPPLISRRISANRKAHMSGPRSRCSIADLRWEGFSSPRSYDPSVFTIYRTTGSSDIARALLQYTPPPKKKLLSLSLPNRQSRSRSRSAHGIIRVAAHVTMTQCMWKDTITRSS